MIFSLEKKDDIEMRARMLELAAVSLRAYRDFGEQVFWGYAEYFGGESKRLRDIINCGDYAERDRRRREIERVINFNYEHINHCH